MVSIRFPLVAAMTLVPMLDRLCRRLRHSPDRCLLRPVGEVFEGAGDQSPHGVCHRVLWVRRHYRKRESTTSNTHWNSPSGYPVESRHLALCDNTGDCV